MSVGAGVSVVGVTFGDRQKRLASLYKTLSRTTLRPYAELGREPDNEHDPNAIAVLVKAGDEGPYDVGYVPRPLAKKWAARLDAGEKIKVTSIRITPVRRDGKIRFGCEINVELESHDV